MCCVVQQRMIDVSTEYFVADLNIIRERSGFFGHYDSGAKLFRSYTLLPTMKLRALRERRKTFADDVFFT